LRTLGNSSIPFNAAPDGSTSDGGHGLPRSDASGLAELDPGLTALAVIAGHYRISANPSQLAHELGLGGRRADGNDLVRAARAVGLKARFQTGQRLSRLASVPLPCILPLKDGSFVLVGTRLKDRRFRIFNPVTQIGSDENAAAIGDRWTRAIILVTRRAGGAGTDPKTFGFRWFLPSIWRYRGPLGHVMLASFFIQLFSLVTPMFFQVVIDKVLLHKSIATLVTFVVGMVALGLFDVILQYLRTYALSHTSSRIDVELGARLMDHLLRLPLSYFESRAAGQTVARVRELETIRAFLTGQGLTSAIDLLFTLLFFVVLYFYSPVLTLIVMGSVPFYVVIGLLLRPALRDRINEKFDRAAESQQFLVESVVGIQTLKAAAIEPVLRNQWEEKLAAYVSTAFHAVQLTSIGQNTIQFVSKVATALVLFFGALEVINGTLTVGGLVAFNMIMAQVTGPILRLSQLWQDFQQVQVSIERLGDILNFPAESRRLASAGLPPMKGAVKISNVTFRYRPDGPEVLRNVSLDIPQGQVIGIVGPSGSGKSTLTKLVQRLYRPESGQVLIDGIDIGQADTAWLRSQIGVVLQDNILFDRTIHENIALAVPGMSRADVMAVAKLAGADEFISKLPLGYETHIEERGANLSGGQRQRIAIARALATRPRILILDEATSALDYESEQIIQTNMRQIVKGKTVIIIAHRLAAVRNCDRIIAIEDGRIIEDGTHSLLLERSGSLYARLWRMQSQSTHQ
jgi:ATP-binding cassette, subfamily B, bacterial HlyB/CyaB